MIDQIKVLLDPSIPYTGNLNNAFSYIYHFCNDINWIGLYYVDTKKKECVLGSFAGKPACIRIPFQKGVVGTCAHTKQLLNIKDVHQFEGHIACDCASLSELVIPIFDQDTLIAILDIDSPKFNRFENDTEIFTELATLLLPYIKLGRLD